MKVLQKKIETATNAQLDGIWIILRSNVGIFRKINIICALLHVEPKLILNELPRNEKNQIRDRETREEIHNILLPESKKRKNS